MAPHFILALSEKPQVVVACESGSLTINRLAKRQRDLWNIFWGKIPSRRMRRLMLNRILREYDASVFVGIGVTFFDPWNISIHPRCVINAGCIIDGRGGAVTIGSDTDIGLQTHIWTLEHDPSDPDHGVRGGSVVIGDHVWIATRSTILPCTSVGRGTVIGCGTVVTKDLPERSIAAGVPAKVIGNRDNSLDYKLNYHPRFR